MDDEYKNTEISDFLEEQLPVFDEIFAEELMPLHQRPLAATIQFIEYCIVDMKGDTKEDYLKKPWFKSTYQLVCKWYLDRYGDAMKLKRHNSSLGVVMIFDTPLKISIPLSVAGKKESATKRWFCLPHEVLENENVFAWIEGTPNLLKMKAEERFTVENYLRAIATANRSINVNLMSADLKEKHLRNLCSGIPAHIEKAVGDILSLDEGRISNSFWEIHLAVEKALKLLIGQHNHFPPIHDLHKLCNAANQINDVSIDKDLIDMLPSHHNAIRFRYGEGGTVTARQAVLNYKNGLIITKILTAALRRQFVMENVEFLISNIIMAR
jgi:hypothetical protein